MVWETDTVQKMKFSITDFYSKCDQIRSFLRIWSHLLKKPLLENFIFCVVRSAPSLLQKKKRGSAKSNVSKVLFPDIGKITNLSAHTF